MTVLMRVGPFLQNGSASREIMDNALSMHFLQSQNQKTSQLSILGTRWLPLWELSGKAMTAPLMPFWLVTKPP